MSITSVEVSARTLEETPGRAVPLLRAIATNVSIRQRMLSVGYTDAEQALGWELTHKASGFVAPEPLPTDDAEARAAIAEVDDWEEQAFRRAKAALDRLHPEQSAFVFAGLQPTQGPEAIVTVTTFLDRIDALDASPERSETRQADRAALETLEQRRLGKAERARIRGLLSVAQSVKPPVVPQVPLGAEERQAALRQLRAWYVDWSETARAVIRRRDHLILMGLAHRRSREEALVHDEAGDEIEDDRVAPARTEPPAPISVAS